MKSEPIAPVLRPLNLLNDDAYENVGSRLGTSDSYALPTQFILPRRFLLGAKLKF